MVIRLIVSLVILSLVFSSSGVEQPQPSCRCLAFGKCWPDSQAWKKFNSSIDGRLIKVLPPAAPCHDPFFDEQACKVAREKWNYPFWRADHPGAMEQANWEWSNGRGCLISSNRTSTCFQGAVPIYAVDVARISHVQDALRFASKHNLRLVIRNTGHDFFGRSTAPGSLSIWLHHLKSIRFHDSFVPYKCHEPVKAAAVTVGAGVQWEEVYQAAFQHKRVIGGGFCASVGAAGGYVQGTGHGPLSPIFGLAADNVLQYQVVTADGKFLTANACQNPELFWALRGGGGGTFGVVISVTYRTHPAFQNLIYASINITTTDKASLQEVVTRFAELTPALSNDGWSGSSALSNITLVVGYLLPNRDMAFANKSISPLVSYVQKKPGVQIVSRLQNFSSFLEWHLQTQCNGQPTCFQLKAPADLTTFNAPAGDRLFLGSRLIPKDTIKSSPVKLSKALLRIADLQKGTGQIQIFMVGGQVSVPQNNPVNPAWRRALWFVVLTTDWKENAPKFQISAAAKLVTDGTKLLTDLTPGSGTYLNEADYNQPNWQQSFWGPHYKRLYAFKHKIDPAGLFVCHHCVGSEDWSSDLNCRIPTLAQNIPNPKDSNAYISVL